MPAANNGPSADESESPVERSVAVEELAERVYQLMCEELRLDLARSQTPTSEGRI
jgi:hypothetical protein